MKLAILDLESDMYVKLYKEDKTFEEIVEVMDKSIRNLFYYTGCTHYIGFLTTKSFRYDIFPEYKGTRKKEKPKFYYELKQYLIDNYSFVSIEGYEADDLCASCVRWCKQSNIEYVVCNIDFDLDQLDGDHFNYNKTMYYNVSKFEAMYNLATQMFVSQSGDNIKPCSGIGKVACVNILSECKTQLDFIKQVINIYKNGYGKFKGYKDYKDKIRFFYSLVYLKQDVELDYQSNIKQI
jgi:5'-3' exonuclease